MGFTRLIDYFDKWVREDLGDYYIVTKDRLKNIESCMENLKSENKELMVKCAELKVENAELKVRNAELRVENCEMKEQFANKRSKR